jgi:hypothetical protein
MTKKIVDQPEEFAEIFKGLYGSEYQKVRISADIVDDSSLLYPELLLPFKQEIFWLSKEGKLIQLKWHLAKLFPRISLTEDEWSEAWELLMNWARDRKESRIVRVNAVQSLAELVGYYPELKQEYQWLMEDLYQENIPSLNARIRILRKKYSF